MAQSNPPSKPEPSLKTGVEVTPTPGQVLPALTGVRPLASSASDTPLPRSASGVPLPRSASAVPLPRSASGVPLAPPVPVAAEPPAPEPAPGPASADSSDDLGYIGQYRLRQLIGEGSMGLVYRAEDTFLRR